MGKKKKTAGRPKKPASQRRDTDIRIPVTAAEKRSIESAARSAGGRGEIAAWARDILLEAAKKS